MKVKLSNTSFKNKTEDFLRSLSIILCLRRKTTLIIGTNRQKMLYFIGKHFGVGNNPKCTIHTGIDNYVIERCVNSLTLKKLNEYLQNKYYDEIIIYSTFSNNKNINEKIPNSRLLFVSY